MTFLKILVHTSFTYLYFVECNDENIIETKFGTLVNTSKIAAGSASSIKKTGAFYNFSIRVSQDDIREYSFTDLARAEYMRRIMIGHLEEKIKKESKG